MATPLTTYPTAASNLGEALWQNLPFQPNGVLVPTRGQGLLAVFADSTGMQVKVTGGSVSINNFVGDLASQQTIAIATPDATRGRIDRVVARLDTSGSAALISIVVITGTPASSPTAPAAGAQDVTLATVVVDPSPNATIAANKVTTSRTWTGNAAWADVGNITVRTAASDTNTVVQGTPATIFARYRYVNGTMEIKYRVTVNLSNYPAQVYLGLPSFGKYTAMSATVNEHAVGCHTSTIDSGTDISWILVTLTDLWHGDAAYSVPISAGSPIQHDIWISGTTEVAG